ncbi:MAG TPA: phosphopentomutase [Anaerolineae bacterium]|nr:phosphopentomutase [Anaerolineae bacterium]
MSAVKRVILIVLDSMGVGELPDAAEYGDEGSNTLANTAKAVGGLSLPHMQQLGLGNITAVVGVPPCDEPLGAYGRMAEASAGKDTTTGHWEIVGIYSPRPLPTYPHGFPKELIEEYERRIGRKTLGNYPRSGTVIIQELGEEHIRTGYPIVYTSADSVFQVAAHEEVIPVEELYRICQIAREMLVGEHAVGRVIARPFIGEPGNFVRTERRKDFSIPPPEPTLLDRLVAAGQPVMGVGKIEDIFAHRGLSQSVHSPSNMACVDQTLVFMRESQRGLIFTNLVDFDMLWGHRNNPQGYAGGLEDFDRRLPEITEAMTGQDVLFLTADHGNDPTTPSTDHSREYVPLLVYGSMVKPGVDLGTRETFADLGATVAELLGIEPLPFGTSFAGEILRE